MFFDRGHGSLSVVKRIRNTASKTTLVDSKYTSTQSQKQETLSGWPVTGRVSFVATVIKDLTEIPDSQDDREAKEEENEEIIGEKQGEEAEFEYPLSDLRDVKQLIKDLINNVRYFRDTERRGYSGTK